MATASEVIGFMREHAHEFSNGFGYGRGAVRNFTEGVYGFAKDFLGGLVGGWIRLADGSVVRATAVCDAYGVTKGWGICDA